MNDISIYRMLDANLNRAAEGIRTLEDIARFALSDQPLTKELRSIRHRTRELSAALQPRLLAGRDAANDIGLAISQEVKSDQRDNLFQVAAGAVKRLQEALRVVEESLKLVSHYPLAKQYEALRYEAYALEKNFNSALESQLRRRRLPGGIYGITAHELSNGRDNVSVAQAMLEGGIRIIQYREKTFPKLRQHQECLAIRRLTEQAEAVFIVNDHVDIAVAVQADGVHIGQEDLPLEAVRRQVGEKMLIGLSTHSPKQGDDAVRRGADYIGVGPIFATQTKKDAAAPVGFEYLDYAAKLPLPSVAIGGIKESNLAEVASHGPTCACLVSDIVGAPDIAAKVKTLRQLWPE